MSTTKLTTLEPSIPVSSDADARRRPLILGLIAGAVIAAVITTYLIVGGPTAPQHKRATPAPPAPTGISTLHTPGFAFGFYSAGLRLVDCYGTCHPGTKGYTDQQADRRRMADLEAMHVTFVTNNETIVRWYHHYPAAVLAYLADLHAHHIRVSYSVASGPNAWFVHGRFDPAQANRAFARTDLNHDGVSDLNGKLDVLYQGHEVLEWATHAQRVQIYRVAKKWFPTTPVAPYYAGFDRPFEPSIANTPHPSGPGGSWRDYAYGPGEADAVLVNVRRDASPTAVDTANTRRGHFVVADFAAAAAKDVALIRRITPGVKIFISTNIAGDSQMQGNPGSMWSAADLAAWYHALAGIPGVDGVFLRSYGRFTYDLGNSMYAAQQATWRQLGAQSARISASPGAP